MREFTTSLRNQTVTVDLDVPVPVHMSVVIAAGIEATLWLIFYCYSISISQRTCSLLAIPV